MKIKEDMNSQRKPGNNHQERKNYENIIHTID